MTLRDLFTTALVLLLIGLLLPTILLVPIIGIKYAVEYFDLYPKYLVPVLGWGWAACFAFLLNKVWVSKVGKYD